MNGLDKVAVTLDVELGGKWLPVREVLRLGRGAEIDFDTLAGQAVTLRADRVAVAEGLLVPDAAGRLSVRVTRLITRRAGDSSLAA